MSSWSPPPARSTRLYIGGVTHATRTHDLEELFSRYGPLREVTIKEGFGFIEFVDPRDADAAERKYGGSRGVTTAGGDRLRVEFAKDRHSERRPRERMIEHRVMQRCYQCGKEGHIRRSRSRSPARVRRRRSPSPRRRSPSSPRPRRRHSRSTSRSPSPSPRHSHSHSHSRSAARREKRGRSLSPPRSRSRSRSDSKHKKEESPTGSRHRHRERNDERAGDADMDRESGRDERSNEVQNGEEKKAGEKADGADGGKERHTPDGQHSKPALSETLNGSVSETMANQNGSHEASDKRDGSSEQQDNAA